MFDAPTWKVYLKEWAENAKKEGRATDREINCVLADVLHGRLLQDVANEGMERQIIRRKGK